MTVLKESERLIDWNVRDFTVVRFVVFTVRETYLSTAIKYIGSQKELT